MSMHFIFVFLVYMHFICELCLNNQWNKMEIVLLSNLQYKLSRPRVAVKLPNAERSTAIKWLGTTGL